MEYNLFLIGLIKSDEIRSNCGNKIKNQIKKYNGFDILVMSFLQPTLIDKSL